MMYKNTRMGTVSYGIVRNNGKERNNRWSSKLKGRKNKVKKGENYVIGQNKTRSNES